jgi:allophanate hydrolase
MDVAAGYDAGDPYARRCGQQRSWPRQGFRFGVPSADLLEFFGDEESRALFESACDALCSRGGCRVEIDYSIFRDAAHLLYAGPWVAERLAAIQEFATANPDALHPVTAKIILGAAKLTAADTFKAIYRLAELAAAAQQEWEKIDVMLLPTAARHYTHEEICADPITRNSDLGYYTNFVNLLDFAAVAAPWGRRANGLPFGVSFIGPAWSDRALLRTAGLFETQESDSASVDECPAGYVPLAVCGAHLTGQPLNHQLTGVGAFLLRACQTSPEYRLYALKGTVPPKPGLVRVAERGTQIEVEVWAVPISVFGAFVAAVPPPLAIGSCVIDNGRQVKSFVCEPWALADAEDITSFGGWRAWLARDKEFVRSR